MFSWLDVKEGSAILMGLLSGTRSTGLSRERVPGQSFQGEQEELRISHPAVLKRELSFAAEPAGFVGVDGEAAVGDREVLDVLAGELIQSRTEGEGRVVRGWASRSGDSSVRS